MKLKLESSKCWHLPARLAACPLLALLLAALAPVLAAEPASFAPTYHASFKAASDAATADQSLVLLIFSAEWCGPCKLLKGKTLASPEFLQQQSPLHVADVDVDTEQKLAHDFAVDAIPALILLTGDGKIVMRQTGFMEVTNLMTWLQTGRIRAAAGQWEGTVPGAPLDEFVRKSAMDNLNTNDLQRLVELLGDADPANRDQAGKIIRAQRQNAVPALILGVGNTYLGVRIGASELLQRLAPGLAPVDPWQSPSEMSNAVVVLQKWWAETGRLPATAAAGPTGTNTENEVKVALEQLRNDDPERRTEAMTELVNCGLDALPAVREAIKHAERTGDQRALGLLEDVRWTILVPEAIEQQSGGVRNVLARGKSSERQAAAERLGRIGRDALGILTELAGDSDPLVVESTVRTLAGIRSDDSVAALAALLQSPDSNLRMTAAQALGHTKNQLAVKPLLAAANDPDEVVACTALSGIEEVEERETYNRKPRDLPKEVTDRLTACLTDPRWRVRAAAAETVGKLSVSGMTDDLKKLLGDSDGFVVKSALTALGALNAAPEPAQLSALSKRLPSLQGDAVEMLLQSETEDNIKTVTDLFGSGTTDTRVAVLSAFLRRGYSGNQEADEGWKPMFTQAVNSTEPRLRRVAAEVLGRRSTKLSAPLVGVLLTDEDRETREAAASVVLQILNNDHGGASGQRMLFSISSSGSSSPKTNTPLVNEEQMSKWHVAMLKQLDSAPGLVLAAAVFATGDGKTDLPMLLAALAGTNNGAVSDPHDKERMSLAIGAVMPKLVLPEDRPVLEKLSESPVRFAIAVSQSACCRPGVIDYLLEPARFKATMEPAAGPELTDALELLAGYDYTYSENHPWSIWNETERTKAIVLSLVDSTNAGWRAAAVFSLGLGASAPGNLAVFEKALADPDPWVRDSAVKAIARNVKERPALEKDLGPLLADTNLEVAAAAAVALLEPETRTAAGLDSDMNYFEYQTVRGGRGSISSQNDDRPLSVLEGKPPYLQLARNWLAATHTQNSAAFALLLAQFGDFSGVDNLIPQLTAAGSGSDNGESTADPVLAGIALSHDGKYLPALKQLAAVRSEESSLRKVLQAMKGMSGSDARQLRLEINKKIRNAAGGASGTTE